MQVNKKSQITAATLIVIAVFAVGTLLVSEFNGITGFSTIEENVTKGEVYEAGEFDIQQPTCASLGGVYRVGTGCAWQICTVSGYKCLAACDSSSSCPYGCGSYGVSLGVCCDPTIKAYTVYAPVNVCGTYCYSGDSCLGCFNWYSGLCSTCSAQATGPSTPLGAVCQQAFQCSSGACCDGHYYRPAGKHSCPTCQYCTGSSSSCSNVANDQDPYSECATSWTSCDDDCTRRGGDGLCDGAGACDTNDRTGYIAQGSICSGSGNQIAGVCGYGGYDRCSDPSNPSSGFGDIERNESACDGGGNCNYYVGDCFKAIK